MIETISALVFTLPFLAAGALFAKVMDRHQSKLIATAVALVIFTAIMSAVFVLHGATGFPILIGRLA